MDEVISLLEKLFSKDSRYHSKSEIQKLLKLKGERQVEILDSALNTLAEEGKVFFDKKNGYRIFPSHQGFAFGKIEINKSGTGFVHTSDGYTILIENCDLNGALNGDNVIVYNIFNKRKDYFHGEIYKITKRKTGNIIFEVNKTNNSINLIPYNNLENINIDINSNELKDLVDGNLILVKVGCNCNDGLFDATIDRVIGHKDDPNIDVRIILEKYNLPIDFSNKIIEEAKTLPKEVSVEEIENRIDLRNENIFTVDCDNTKDRDDAVSIKKLENGNYLLKVHIAHVSYYVKEGTNLFEEAIHRCSSHYPVNTCIPMLPKIISNGICSLNPNNDRLTRTIEMEIDSEGVIVNYNIYNSVINSKKAMSYSELNKVLNNEYLKDYEPFKKDLILMNELNTILEKARNNRNYINFNTLEVEHLQDKNGDITDFRPNKLGLAGQIIENFMLVANTTVYSNFAWYILAYRIHEYPNEEKVKEVINILRVSGVKIPKINNISSLTLKNLIANLEDNEISQIVRECLLKTMKKARYDTVNLGHFALQYDVYGHFTSPIRRVIDLITHMTIDKIENLDYDKDSINNFQKFLDEVCNHANEIEKIDKLIEIEAMDMKMAEYMEKHIGEKFEVYVTDVSKSGMIVRTKNLIRGKIKLENIEDDKYYYDYDKKAIIGKKTKHKYQIGNKILVLVKDACKETRTVNFEIPKQKILNKIP